MSYHDGPDKNMPVSKRIKLFFSTNMMYHYIPFFAQPVAIVMLGLEQFGFPIWGQGSGFRV